MSDDVRDRLRTLAQTANGHPATLARLILDEFVVIPKSDLPEVKEGVRYGKPNEITVDGIYRTVGREFYSYDAATARKTGLALLAVADHLDAQVDEAQVEAVKKALRDASDSSSAEEFARRLVRAGVRVEVTS